MRKRIPVGDDPREIFVSASIWIPKVVPTGDKPLEVFVSPQYTSHDMHLSNTAAIRSLIHARCCAYVYMC